MSIIVLRIVNLWSIKRDNLITHNWTITPEKFIPSSFNIQYCIKIKPCIPVPFTGNQISHVCTLVGWTYHNGPQHGLLLTNRFKAGGPECWEGIKKPAQCVTQFYFYWPGDRCILMYRGVVHVYRVRHWPIYNTISKVLNRRLKALLPNNKQQDILCSMSVSL